MTFDSQVSIVGMFADFVRGVRVVYHFTDHARVTLGQHLGQQVTPPTLRETLKPSRSCQNVLREASYLA